MKSIIIAGFIGMVAYVGESLQIRSNDHQWGVSSLFGSQQQSNRSPSKDDGFTTQVGNFVKGKVKDALLPSWMS